MRGVMSQGSSDAPRIVRLPDPTQHARRQRDATNRLLVPAGNRLLYVASVGTDGTAVLKDAAGVVIDEDVVVVGGRVGVGDQVVRLTIPGTGHRDAAASYVALGPIQTAALMTPPAVSVGVALPNGSISAVSGTDSFVRVTFVPGAGATAGVILHVQFATPRPNGNYALIVSGRGPNGAKLAAEGTYQTNSADTGTDVGALVAPTGTSVVVNLVFVDPLVAW